MWSLEAALGLYQLPLDKSSPCFVLDNAVTENDEEW